VRVLYAQTSASTHKYNINKRVLGSGGWRVGGVCL